MAVTGAPAKAAERNDNSYSVFLELKWDPLAAYWRDLIVGMVLMMIFL